MLELLKEFVGRLMPNDRKVCTTSTVNDLNCIDPLIIDIQAEPRNTWIYCQV